MTAYDQSGEVEFIMYQNEIRKREREQRRNAPEVLAILPEYLSAEQ
jgi:hypothetical protein